jgi:hypothetical protein
MQSTGNILLVKPSSFGYNAETARSNAFQHTTDLSKEEVLKNARAEFDAVVNTLRSKGINVLVAADTINPAKPDAVFPNNWASYHADGTIILYPMCTPNRRIERRPEIIDLVKEQYTATQLIDLSVHESAGRFLEGTGSIIFDHAHKIAYACLSPRTDKGLFEEVSGLLHYKPVSFYAHDREGREIYHSNVMMCIAENFSVICLNSISNIEERKLVTRLLAQTGHQIIDISFEQMNNFAGNMLALKTITGKNLLVMSQSAFDSLTLEQKTRISPYCEIVTLTIPTIESIGGGSARCMIAEIFLPLKQ